MIRKTFMVPISLLLLLLFNSNIFSQTIIKERVGIKSHELNFKSIRSDTLKNLKIGDPVLSANIQSGEEVLKTTKVTLPFEGYATVTILGGDAAGRHTLILRSPENIVIIENPLYRVDYKWLSPKYSGGTELDFGLLLKNRWGKPPTPEEGAIRKSLGSNEYEFWYNDDSTDFDYNDVIINVKFCNRIDKVTEVTHVP